MASEEDRDSEPDTTDVENRTVLVRWAILVCAVFVLSFTAPSGHQALHIAALLQVLFLFSLLFAAIRAERPTRNRLTRFDEAAGFLALSLLVHAVAGGAATPVGMVVL